MVIVQTTIAANFLRQTRTRFLAIGTHSKISSEVLMLEMFAASIEPGLVFHVLAWSSPTFHARGTTSSNVGAGTCERLGQQTDQG